MASGAAKGQLRGFKLQPALVRSARQDGLDAGLLAHLGSPAEAQGFVAGQVVVNRTKRALDQGGARDNGVGPDRVPVASLALVNKQAVFRDPEAWHGAMLRQFPCVDRGVRAFTVKQRICCDGECYSPEPLRRC